MKKKPYKSYKKKKTTIVEGYQIRLTSFISGSTFFNLYEYFSDFFNIDETD